MLRADASRCFSIAHSVMALRRSSPQLTLWRNERFAAPNGTVPTPSTARQPPWRQLTGAILPVGFLYRATTAFVRRSSKPQINQLTKNGTILARCQAALDRDRCTRRLRTCGSTIVFLPPRSEWRWPCRRSTRLTPLPSTTRFRSRRPRVRSPERRQQARSPMARAASCLAGLISTTDY